MDNIDPELALRVYQVLGEEDSSVDVKSPWNNLLKTLYQVILTLV